MLSGFHLECVINGHSPKIFSWSDPARVIVFFLFFNYSWPIYHVLLMFLLLQLLKGVHGHPTTCNSCLYVS